MKIKVLICDDSRIMRKLLGNVVGADDRIDVVGQAENGVDCLEKIAQLQPDVVSLDLNMPVMDGINVLRESKKRQLRTQFLVVSSLAKKDAQITLDALEEGAIDFVLKPSQAFNIAQMGKELIDKIVIVYQHGLKEAKAAGLSPAPPQAPAAGGEATPGAAPATSPAAAPAPEAAPPAPARHYEMNVIGGSSGAVQTLLKVIPFLPADFASTIVLVLHLPPFFTTQFTNQLNNKCKVPVEEAASNLPMQAGKIYTAPGGDQNIILEKDPSGQHLFQLIPNDAEALYTPSIDVYMASVADIFGEKSRGFLISGTGQDGVEGLRIIRNSGGSTFVQDKATAIANQLPFAALKAGVAEKAVNIQEMIDLLSKS